MSLQMANQSTCVALLLNIFRIDQCESATETDSLFTPNT